MSVTDRQKKRWLARTAFFLLFVLAPPLDIFRLDLNLKHFIVFGWNWTLGLEPFLSGQAGAGSAAWNLFLRAFVPGAALIGVFAWASWKYGRLYCGWLCPHFSVVELINGLMRRASAKPTLWERKPLPELQPDGSRLAADRRYWPLALLAIMTFAFLWALTLLTYMLPPAEIYHNLWHGELTRNQGVFLMAATSVFTIEFLLARHLFCRFGCAVGLAQSFIWMANKQAMVVGFDGERASACAACNAACDNACPMRLKPRATKRWKFSCTQCSECITACRHVQAGNPQGSLLEWVEGECALHVSARDFGRKPVDATRCFQKQVAINPKAESRNLEPS